jgi:UPF0176 protein
MTPTPDDIVVAALYKFTRLEDPPAVQAHLRAAADAAETCGTLLVAREGINGTVSGTRGGIDSLLDAIRQLPGCADLEHKESIALAQPFKRMKVRLKREIVTMGIPDIDPGAIVGTYVPPDAWNALISDPDVITIDTRNDYEVAIGTFKGAINPKTASFRDLPGWIRENLNPARQSKVAMFCTGGIRCEKSTALLKSLGFEEVYHLQGGILKYLEVVPENESLWEGACFVFDERVSLTHGLAIGPHVSCPDCGRPHESGRTCAACCSGT